MWTDPPYNLAGEGNVYAASALRQESYSQLKDAEWDRAFDPHDAASMMLAWMATDAAVYVCTSQHLFGDWNEWMCEWAKMHCYCVWCKPNPMPSMAKRHWTWATELIVYGTRGKHVFNFPDVGHALNWLEVATEQHDRQHPTQKPVALVKHCLEHSSQLGQCIADPFLGSGTTLIAAEQLGRVCYGIEISERYTDVAVRRWAQATGQVPVLEADGTEFEVT